MLTTRQPVLPVRIERNPFALLRNMRTGFDRMFQDPFFASLPLPALEPEEPAAWVPTIEVFEKDRKYVTRIDLPGLKKDDVKVEIADERLVISGERKREIEETKDNVYRCEREYGSFYRAVPLPEGVNPEEVAATFADGVLEVAVPIPPAPKPVVRAVAIQEPVKPMK